jgi:hypothetical protein
LADRSQQLLCRGEVGGVRAGQINRSGAIGCHREHQETDQVVVVQQPHLLG